MKDGKEVFTEFSDAQIVTSTSTFAAAINKLREHTLDNDIDDRLIHEIMLLGTRDILTDAGVDLKPMTVGRFKDLVVKSFKVSGQAVDNDISKLKKTNIINANKGALEDGRSSLLHLAEVGDVLYRLMGHQMACLILAMADLLREQGTVPVDPRAFVDDFIDDYSIPLARKAKQSRGPDSQDVNA